MFYLALAALVYAICTAGRMLAAQPPYRRESFNLATAWCAGYGVFALWWLVGRPLLGGGPLVTPAAFGLAAGLLASGMYQQWHAWPREQHHTAHVLIVLLLAAPLLPLLLHVWPEGAGFWQQASVALALGNTAPWPTPQTLLPGVLPSVPGLVPLLAPLGLLGDLARPPLVPLLVNLGCVLAASGALLGALNWPVKWSNLPLVAAGSLSVVLLLNPWLPLVQLASAQSQLFPALCLLVAALPLLNPMPLATGATALGPALALVSLTLLHPLGWLLSLWVAAVWGVRMLAESVTGPDHARRHGLALTLLVTLPALAWAGWQYVLLPFHAAVASLLVNAPGQFLAALFAQIPAAVPDAGASPLRGALHHFGIAGVLLFAVIRPVFARFATSGRHLCTTYAAFFMPLLLLVPPLALAAGFGLEKAQNILEIQQFIWLVPVAAWAGQRYRHSVLREHLYAAPWTYGLVFCIILFSFILFLSRPQISGPGPWRAVAADLAPYPLVLTAGLPPAAVQEINYHSKGYRQVVAIPEGQYAPTLAWLRQHPLPLLAVSNTLGKLGISAKNPAPLVLFQPGPSGATLLRQWKDIP